MNPKIMVVDDEDVIRETLELMLEKEGYEIKLANNGEEFLEKLDEFQPDLVTLDIMMPGLTTIEIFQKIKEKKSNPKIIIVSAAGISGEEKERILSLGNIVDYICKPFNSEELQKTLDKHIKRIK